MKNLLITLFVSATIASALNAAMPMPGAGGGGVYNCYMAAAQFLNPNTSSTIKDNTKATMLNSGCCQVFANNPNATITGTSLTASDVMTDINCPLELATPSTELTNHVIPLQSMTPSSAV